MMRSFWLPLLAAVLLGDLHAPVHAAESKLASPRWPPKIPHPWPLQLPPLDELAMM